MATPLSPPPPCASDPRLLCSVICVQRVEAVLQDVDMTRVADSLIGGPDSLIRGRYTRHDYQPRKNMYTDYPHKNMFTAALILGLSYLESRGYDVYGLELHLLGTLVTQISPLRRSCAHGSTVVLMGCWFIRCCGCRSVGWGAEASVPGDRAPVRPAHHLRRRAHLR